MRHVWLYLSHSDIETERRQCREEGKDLSRLDPDFEHVLSLDLENLDNQAEAEALLDRSIELPQRADCDLDEPSDLAGIRACRPARRFEAKPVLPSLDRMHGAWAGRAAGCLLGKPVEGWRRDRMWDYLQTFERWPLSDYFRADVMTEEFVAKHHIWTGAAFADRVTAMPEDDDMNYTTTGLAITKRRGRSFTPDDVANFWLSDIPILRTCTAERVAYRNFCLLKGPPESASFRNPYREWIGAQIRADFWGYIAAGDPELAASYAWRDASISHVKNGIYGEMWAAAMIAAAFVASSPWEAIEAGLGEIPDRCRLADAIRRVVAWHETGKTYDEAVEALHLEWEEARAHDWCHTISNAMVVCIALLWGEADFGLTICRAVQACFDTDCNGATSGSVIGAMHGYGSLPPEWLAPMNDTLHTGVDGYHTVRLGDVAAETLRIAQSA